MHRTLILCACVLALSLSGCLMSGPCPPTAANYAPPADCSAWSTQCFQHFSEPMHPYLNRQGQAALIPRSGLAEEMQSQ